MAQVLAPRKAKQQVVMKAESSYGVDVLGGTYVLTDVMRAVSDSIRVSPNLEEFLNLATAGNLGRLPSAIGIRTCRVSWDMIIRGAGVAYSASVKPEADLPLRGCGLAATLVATTGVEKVTYQASDTHEAMTLYVVQDVPGGNALAAQLAGCHGTFRLTGAAGGPMRFTFEYEGLLEEIADISYVAGSISATPGYPTLKSAGFQIGTSNYAPRISEVDFTLGGQLRRVPSINAAAGLVGFMIADREPLLTIDPEVDREATSAWWSSLVDGDPLHDCTWQLGASQYNRMLFSVRATGAGTAAGIQVVSMDWIERDGLAALRMGLRPTIGAGNDDFSLAFT